MSEKIEKAESYAAIEESRLQRDFADPGDRQLFNNIYEYICYQAKTMSQCREDIDLLIDTLAPCTE